MYAEIYHNRRRHDISEDTVRKLLFRVRLAQWQHAPDMEGGANWRVRRLTATDVRPQPTRGLRVDVMGHLVR